jgi:hypothetical protein
MSSVSDLLALVREELDGVQAFFDPYAQLGSAYDSLARMEGGVEFNDLCGALASLPDSVELVRMLEEFAAARARLLHMAMAFAAERKEGKWPELLRQEAHEALRRLSAAIDELETI